MSLLAPGPIVWPAVSHGDPKTTLDSAVNRFLRACSPILLGLLLLTAIGRPGAAQDSLAIAAVVNDDVISVLDLSVRTRMVIVSARLQDTPETRSRLSPEVLRSLIDERLKLQEAKANGVNVPDAAIDSRVDDLAAQNNMPRADFEAVLQRNGILIDALRDQLRAELAWQSLLQRRLLPSVTVTDEEVDEALADLKANLGKPEYRVAEIYLAIDSSTSDDQVRQTAQRLADQLRQGADFDSLARQFSQSATASSGGDLGWVRPGQLDSELDAAVRGLQPGQIAGPIRGTGGYHVLTLLDQRQTGSTSSLDAVVSMKQVFIPLAQSAPATEVEAANSIARSVVTQARSCGDMDGIAKRVNPEANVDLKDLRVGDLPAVLRPIAMSLEIDRPSEPVRVETGIGVFMVCKRDLQESGLPTREDIGRSLRNERLDVLARGYLRDLRRVAYVDIRV